MSDIFISYASEDRPTARALAEALEARGWTVWWDRRIPTGKDYADVIETELTAARCVIVLWSEHSVKSSWVKTEAADASGRGVLIPALIDGVKIPLEFRRLQAADLVGWEGGESGAGFDTLVADLDALLGRPPAPPVVTAPPANVVPPTDAATRKPPDEADAAAADLGAQPERDERSEPSDANYERALWLRLPDASTAGGSDDAAHAGGTTLTGRPARWTRSQLAVAALIVVAVALFIGVYITSTRRNTGEGGNTNRRRSLDEGVEVVGPEPSNRNDQTNAGGNANQNAPNVNLPDPARVTNPESDRKLAALLQELNAGEPRARVRATQTLVDEYAEDPNAVAQVLDLLAEGKVDKLSPQGLINALYFLNRSHISAWTAETYQRAKKAVGVIESRSPAKQASDELNLLKVRVNLPRLAPSNRNS